MRRSMATVCGMRWTRSDTAWVFVPRSSLSLLVTPSHSFSDHPQDNILFENLTVAEHILFFSQLKGFTLQSAEEESRVLTHKFHLEERLDHTAGELSGGQKRKLSVSRSFSLSPHLSDPKVAIAVCGGSKFIVLDEPSAGEAISFPSRSCPHETRDGPIGKTRDVGSLGLLTQRPHHALDYPLHGRGLVSHLLSFILL
jgi:hypothetical protein